MTTLATTSKRRVRFVGRHDNGKTEVSADDRRFQKVYPVTSFQRGETGGERSHKLDSKFDPFRTTRAKSPHIRLPSVGQLSFFRIPEARVSLFRVAALLIVCGIALSAGGQSA